MTRQMPSQSNGNRNIESGYTQQSIDESTPLIGVQPSETGLEISKNDTTEPYLKAARNELGWITLSSSLVIMTMLLQSSIFTANVLAVSHLGAQELASMALSVTCVGVLALAPSFGLLSAMDTFCSTSYTASRDKTLVGFHFQRGIISVVTHLIVVAPVLWNSEKILLALGQHPDLCRLSGLYLRIQILGVLPWSMFEASKRFLQAQGIMRAGTIIAVFVTPIHWFNTYFLVRSPTYGLGFVGAPLVNVLSNWLLFLGVMLYITKSRATEAWGGWSFDAFRSMRSYYKLAIPAVVTVCSEWIAFELLTVGVSYFGANQLAGHAIVLNSAMLIFQISNGLGYGTSPRIGNLIGAAKPRQARIASHMAIMISILVSLSGVLFLTFYGEWWTSMYTSDPEVIRETVKIMPVACVFLVSHGLNAIVGAILRGLGRQRVSANIFLVGFYICAIPSGIYLGYVLRMQAVGLWWGTCIGVIVSFLLHIIYFVKMIDWKDEVRLCLLRLRLDEETIPESGSTADLN